MFLEENPVRADTGKKLVVIDIDSDAETPAKRPCRKLASPADDHSAEEQACDRGVIYDGEGWPLLEGAVLKTAPLSSDALALTLGGRSLATVCRVVDPRTARRKRAVRPEAMKAMKATKAMKAKKTMKAMKAKKPEAAKAMKATKTMKAMKAIKAVEATKAIWDQMQLQCSTSKLVCVHSMYVPTPPAAFRSAGRGDQSDYGRVVRGPPGGHIAGCPQSCDNRGFQRLTFNTCVLGDRSIIDRV